MWKAYSLRNYFGSCWRYLVWDHLQKSICMYSVTVCRGVVCGREDSCWLVLMRTMKSRPSLLAYGIAVLRGEKWKFNDRRWKEWIFTSTIFENDWWVLQKSLLILSLSGPHVDPHTHTILCKERRVLFLPDLWCHLLLRTCMWSSAAGRAAHMHFTSPVVIFGSGRSRVYWTIHNLTLKSG